MQFVDTHCHIHEASYKDPLGALERAERAGVTKLMAVGTDAKTSREALGFAERHEHIWVALGLHPHDAQEGMAEIDELRRLLLEHPAREKVRAIGECGLDYFYDNSPRELQVELLRAQLQLAKEHDLPLIFHVREAFDDFWPIFDDFQGLRGVLHSFTDNEANLAQAVQRGLYIGVNGISTFTKVESQRAMFATIPLEKLLLETDAPFLTPVPKRGTINEPAFVTLVANFLANLRSIPLEELSRATSQNASDLFSI